MDNIFKLHGMPIAIVTGMDMIFTSNLFQDLESVLAAQECLPPTNGWANRKGESMLGIVFEEHDLSGTKSMNELIDIS